MIRIEAVWLATASLDMRCGTDAALARVGKVFGEACVHHAYLCANARANRMKVLGKRTLQTVLQDRAANSMVMGP